MEVSSLPHCIENCTRKEVRGHTLQGHSISTERTGFYSYHLDSHFDAGMACYIMVKRLFLTHLHGDHVSYLPMLLRSKRVITTLYCPKEDVEKTKNMLNSFYNAIDTQISYKIVGVEPGYTEEIIIKKKSYIMKVYDCCHTVPCRGYGFSEKRQKLKKEYQEMKGKEIGRLRREGIEISDEIAIPFFIYMCDTSIDALTPEILSYKVVMVECTFWEKDMEARAENTGHICWTQLKEIIKKNPKTHFILFHVSKRYTWNKIIGIVQESKLNNITLWEDKNHNELTK